MAKKSQPVEPEPEEEVTCPVCGKPVGIDVASCPNCGAEFEDEVEVEEAVEEEAAPVAAPSMGSAVSEDEMAECPVCGKSVSLSLSTCPNCGAEFEEEEVEEVIEVEEREAPVEEPEEEVVRKPVRAEPREPAGWSLMGVIDLRIIGVALVVLGIIGSQISAMIDWYWSWVPPIKTHLGLFVALPIVLIIAGLLIYMLVKNAASSGKKVPSMMSDFTLSLLVFGVFALILMMFWSPINSALQHSSLGVAGVFIGILIVGILSMVMGQRMTAKAASA